jgi:hypothetical protein
MEQPIEFLIRAGQPDTVDRLREYAVRRLSWSLRRFERRIRHITVRIADVNGPRAGNECSARRQPPARPQADSVAH